MEMKERMFADYEKRSEWAKKMLINISQAGFFSSDRTIAQYNEDIWKLEFSDAPSMDESTEPEDLQQATDSVSGAGDEWELEEKEQEDDSEQGDIHV